MVYRSQRISLYVLWAFEQTFHRAKLDKQSTHFVLRYLHMSSAHVLCPHMISTSKQRDHQRQEPISINTVLRNLESSTSTMTMTKKLRLHFLTRCLSARITRYDTWADVSWWSVIYDVPVETDTCRDRYEIIYNTPSCYWPFAVFYQHFDRVVRDIRTEAELQATQTLTTVVCQSCHARY